MIGIKEWGGPSDRMVEVANSALAEFPLDSVFLTVRAWITHFREEDSLRWFELTEAAYDQALRHAKGKAERNLALLFLALLHWQQARKVAEENHTEPDYASARALWHQMERSWSDCFTEPFTLWPSWVDEIRDMVQDVAGDDRRWIDLFSVGWRMHKMGLTGEALVLLKLAYDDCTTWPLQQNEVEVRAKLTAAYLISYATYLQFFENDIAKHDSDPHGPVIDISSGPIKAYIGWKGDQERIKVEIGDWHREVRSIGQALDAFRFISDAAARDMFDTIVDDVSGIEGASEATALYQVALSRFLDLHPELQADEWTVHHVERSMAAGLVQEGKYAGRLRYYAGKNTFERGDYPRALDHLTQARKWLGDEIDVNSYYAAACAVMDRMSEASRVLAGILDKTPQTEIIFALVGHLIQVSGGKRELADVLQSAVKQNLAESRHERSLRRCRTDFGDVWDAFPADLQGEIAAFDAAFEESIRNPAQSTGPLLAQLGRILEMSLRVCFLRPLAEFLESGTRITSLRVSSYESQVIARDRDWRASLERTDLQNVDGLLIAAREDNKHLVATFVSEVFRPQNRAAWRHWYPDLLREARHLRNLIHETTQPDQLTIARLRSILWTMGVLYELGLGYRASMEWLQAKNKTR